jgi:hypothetical protein
MQGGRQGHRRTAVRLVVSPYTVGCERLGVVLDQAGEDTPETLPAPAVPSNPPVSLGSAQGTNAHLPARSSRPRVQAASTRRASSTPCHRDGRPSAPTAARGGAICRASAPRRRSRTLWAAELVEDVDVADVEDPDPEGIEECSPQTVAPSSATTEYPATARAVLGYTVGRDAGNDSSVRSRVRICPAHRRPR